MKTLKQRTRRFPTLQAYMEATGVNQAELARRAGIKPSHLANILRKSRRCSLDLALRLNKLTSVPIETIAGWPPNYEDSAR